MAYVTPNTWVTNDLITAAKLNQDLRDNVEFLHDSYAAWTSFTPSLTQSGAVTKTVTYAKYIQFGKTVHAQVYLSVTGSGTGANPVVVGLPVTAAHGSVVRAYGSGIIFDSSATSYYAGIPVPLSTSTVALIPANGAIGNYLGSADFTAALASGDQVSYSVTYEAA